MERAVGAAERLGDPLYLAWSLTHRGSMCLCTGDWEAARTDLGRSVAMHRQLGGSSKAAWALALLGRLHRLEGAWETATREHEESRAIAERGGYRMILLHSHGEQAEIEIGQGQPSAACRRLLPLLKHSDMHDQLVGLVLPRLAWAYLELGRTREAAELAQQAASHVRRTRYVRGLAEVLWLQAHVACRQEHWVEAADLLEEGLSLTRSIPYPYMEARSLQVCGLMHIQKWEPELAQGRLEAALAIFHRLGARKDIEQTEQLLATHLHPHE
jgi:tetratricopeptide (TPR) repeat protein